MDDKHATEISQRIIRTIDSDDEDVIFSALGMAVGQALLIVPLDKCEDYLRLMHDHAMRERRRIQDRIDLYREFPVSGMS